MTQNRQHQYYYIYRYHLRSIFTEKKVGGVILDVSSATVNLIKGKTIITGMKSAMNSVVYIPKLEPKSIVDVHPEGANTKLRNVRPQELKWAQSIETLASRPVEITSEEAMNNLQIYVEQNGLDFTRSTITNSSGQLVDVLKVGESNYYFRISPVNGPTFYLRGDDFKWRAQN